MGIFELSDTQRHAAQAELTQHERVSLLAPLAGQVATTATAFFGGRPPSTHFATEKPVQISDYLPVRLGGIPLMSISIEKGGPLNPNIIRAYTAPIGAEFQPGAAEKVAEFDNTDPSLPRVTIWPVDHNSHDGSRIQRDLLTTPPETFQQSLTEAQLLAQVIARTFPAQS